MRKTLVALGCTAVGLVAVLRYQPGQGNSSAEPVGSTTAPAVATEQPGVAPPTGSQPTGSQPTSEQPTGSRRTIAGPVVDTPYGSVQIQAVLASGKLQDVALLQVPSEGRSKRINGNAAPILRQEALQAQSARIDTVSGATYTSQAYAQSLQAALDANGR